MKIGKTAKSHIATAMIISATFLFAGCGTITPKEYVVEINARFRGAVTVKHFYHSITIKRKICSSVYTVLIECVQILQMIHIERSA